MPAALVVRGLQKRYGSVEALAGGDLEVADGELVGLLRPNGAGTTRALDPGGRRTVRRLLEELQGRGVSVLLTSHLLSEVELVCDRVAIMLRGRLVTEGAPSELARPRGVEIETDEGTRLFPDAGREDVPRIVRELVGGGREVYGVRTLTSTLEEVYVEAVEGETS